MQGEFRGDFTRDTANRSKHFLRVLMQQGRVQVDADWNEQVDVLLHYLHALAANIIGPYGGPVGYHANFEVIATANGNSIIDENNFVIGAGQYYVDGILCELEAVAVPIPNENVLDAFSKVLLPGWFSEHSSFREGQYLAILFREREKADQQFLHAKITGSKINSQKQLELTLSFFPEREAPAVDSITDIKIRPLTTYVTQPHLLIEQEIIEDGGYLVYLDVWERHVSHIEDRSDYVPGIREVALGGVDTATRSQIVWQVKFLPINGTVSEELVKDIKGMDDFREILDKVRGGSTADVYHIIRPGTGQLIARARRPDTGMTDPCTISPESRYRGAENQLYRVEIFSINADGRPEFVWSRENSAVTFPILGSPETKSTGEYVVTLEHLGRDRRFSIAEGNLVEIVDVAAANQDRNRAAFKINKIDPEEHRITLEFPSKGSQDTPSFGNNSFLRRWDCFAPHPIDISKAPGGWISLENGIEIKFQSDDHKSYQVGDYWLIPARTETGDVEWNGSSNNPLPMLPHGVSHHYAPLAIISVNDNEIVTDVKDCRRLINRPLLIN